MLDQQNILPFLTYPVDSEPRKRFPNLPQSKHIPYNSYFGSDESSPVEPFSTTSELESGENHVYISIDPALRSCYLTVMLFTRVENQFVLQRLEIGKRLQSFDFLNVEDTLRTIYKRGFSAHLALTVQTDFESLWETDSEILKNLPRQTKVHFIIEKQKEEPYISIEKAYTNAFVYKMTQKKLEWKAETICPIAAARFYGLTINEVGSRDRKKEISVEVMERYLNISMNNHVADTFLNWAYSDKLKPHIGKEFKDAISSYRHNNPGIPSGDRDQLKRNLRSQVKKSRFRRTRRS